MHEQLLKWVTRNSNSIKLRGKPNRRIARLVGNQGGLAENVVRVELSNSLTVALYLRLAMDNKIDFVAKSPVGEDCLSWLEVLPVYRFVVKDPELRDVTGQEGVENPVSNHAKLPV